MATFKFTTTILQVGNNTGIEVPETIIEQMNAGKKPGVVVTVNDYTYQNTVAVMGGKYMIAFSAEHRKKSGLGGGDKVAVMLQPETAPRVVELPADFKAKLHASKKASAFYETLSPSGKKKIVTLIESAKTEVTRNQRIEKYIDSLAKGEKI